ARRLTMESSRSRPLRAIRPGVFEQPVRGTTTRRRQAKGISMTGSPVLREKMYRAYLEFFEVAETKRRWNIFNDVPWEALDSSIGSEQKAARIEVFCAEELYLPDYSAG